MNHTKVKFLHIKNSLSYIQQNEYTISFLEKKNPDDTCLRESGVYQTTFEQRHSQSRRIL